VRVAILLALLSSATWGTADFLGGLLSRRLAAYLVVGASQTCGLIAVTVVALATGAFGGDAGWVGWAVLAGLTGTVGLITFYVALASGTMGIVSPIAALGVLVPVVVGVAQGERPSTLTSVGVVVALLGAVAASGPELRGRAGARPVALAMVAGVMFGLALTFIALGASHDAVMTLWGMRMTSVLGFAIAAVLALGRGHRATLALRDLGLIACVGVGDATANLFFALASTRSYVSVTSVLASLYPVMTVLLARAFLNERLLRVQQVGVVAALAGVVLVSAG
jgi:drug/metabolite transporter (DMT)-like permease